MRWKCVCAYDGSRYSGWQAQSEKASVQQTLVDTLSVVMKHPVAITGSGRTDAGVHALGQVFHFDGYWPHGSDSLVKAISSRLPPDIQVKSATQVREDFHARFSAKTKRYHYRFYLGQADPFIWPYCLSVSSRINLNTISAAMKLLKGEKDFASFAANRGQDYETTVRNVIATSLYQDHRYVYLSFEAEGFMYKMVRSMVGLILKVGLGNVTVAEAEELIEAAKRVPVIEVAPARGLFLEKVFY